MQSLQVAFNFCDNTVVAIESMCCGQAEIKVSKSTFGACAVLSIQTQIICLK